VTAPLPKIDQFGPITDISDPRIRSLIEHLDPFDPKEVIEDVGTATRAAAGMADLRRVVMIPTITRVEHENARFEIREVNGHLVYYIELLHWITPQRFLDDVVKPTFGPLWGSRDTKVDGWLDSEPTRDCGPVVGIWLHDFKLDAMNRAYFMQRIPADISQRIGEQR